MTDLELALHKYDLTVQYVGYDILPYVPGWSHYEAFSKLSPALHEWHLAQYQRHLELQQIQRGVLNAKD